MFYYVFVLQDHFMKPLALFVVSGDDSVPKESKTIHNFERQFE